MSSKIPVANYKKKIPKLLATESGYALGLVLIFFVIFSIIGLTVIKLAGDESVFAARHAHKMKAFYNAEAGIYRGLWLANNVSNSAATYTDATVSVVYDSSAKTLTATGSSGQEERIVRATLTGGDSDVWPYALYSDVDTLQFIAGGGTVTGDIHSNTAISNAGVTVTGVSTQALPNATFPTVDWNYYQQLAKSQGRYYTVSLAGYGSAAPDSGLWYTTGNFYLYDNFTLYGTLIAEKSIYLIGDNISITATPASSPAILSGRTISVRGTGNAVNGLILSDRYSSLTAGDLIIQASSPSFSGASIAKGGMQITTTDSLHAVYDAGFTTAISGIDFNLSTRTRVNLQIVKWEELK